MIERPASVVKELLENSVDAGATRILIEIEQAGKQLIRVSDNGTGMSYDNALLAFERHATSKIQSSEDLEAIHTCGFRGEALASIGSVARVRMVTCDDPSAGGTEIRMEGGGNREIVETAHPQGTLIEIEDLFFNTPARKKFLKTDNTEASHITQVVTQQALAHPGVQFTLSQNGRQVLNTLPSENLIYRITELFGAELTKQLIAVNEVSDPYRLTGYISNPVYTRASRSAQYFFVNNRFVKDKVILHASQKGYSHLLPKGHHPALFLNLTMDPRLLDVNVHPAKAEVRFAYQQEVHRFISNAIRNALTDNDKAQQDLSERYNVVPPENAYKKSFDSLPTQPEEVKTYAPESSSETYAYKEQRHQQIASSLDQFYKQRQDALDPDPSLDRPVNLPTSACPQSTSPMQYEIFNKKPVPVSNLIYSNFVPLGQLDQSFIILQGKEGLLIVDQHVAHERILYERFRDAAMLKQVEIQELLFPINLEFSPSEAQMLLAHIEMLNGLGLDLEPFGGNGFLLRSAPAILKDSDIESLMKDIVHALPSGGGEDNLKEKYEEIVIMMSCRNAIKVHHPLDKNQIEKLLFDLEQTQMPYTCPHGRPIALIIEMDMLLKSFLRK